MNKKPYLVKNSEIAFENTLITVSDDHVVFDHGPERTFTKVTLKPGSSVLAVDDENNAYLVEEYRHAIDKFSTEAVSGGFDKDESPLEAAKRELEEEVGLLAGEWTDLGHVDPFTAAIYSPNHMFLARDLKQTNQKPEETELIKVIKIPLVDAVEMVMSGKITHAATCTLVLKAEKYLQNK